MFVNGFSNKCVYLLKLDYLILELFGRRINSLLLHELDEALEGDEVFSVQLFERRTQDQV